MATIAGDRGRAFMKEMSLRSTGRPFPPNAGEERVVVSLVPTHVTGQ